jgi:hypothetical protein
MAVQEWARMTPREGPQRWFSDGKSGDAPTLNRRGAALSGVIDVRKPKTKKAEAKGEHDEARVDRASGMCFPVMEKIEEIDWWKVLSRYPGF